MKLQILHRTIYRYRRPVLLQPHRLMLLPRSGPELGILAETLRCEPPAAVDWTQDVFGNLIGTASFTCPADVLEIVAEMTVEQTAPEWPVFPISPSAHNYPFVYSESDIADLGALLEPRHADPGGTLLAYARSFQLGSRTDTLSLLKDINAGILTTIAYRERDEEGTQSPLNTLRLASGSCRDIAALFIDAVRQLGFAARAVSGHLFDPDMTAFGGGSTHAWAEVYLPGAGWIAFDPTHRRLGSANLVAVATGRYNAQIMPITGGYLGEADDFIEMLVDVEITRSPRGRTPMDSLEG